MDCAGVNAFLDAVFDCCGLWSWRIGNGMDVIGTNCPLSETVGQLLLSPERKATLSEYLETDGSYTPMILGDILGLVWAVTKDSGSPRSLFILGPVYTGDVSGDMAERLIEPLNISFSKKRELLQSLKSVPTVSSSELFRQTVILHRLVSGKVVQPSEFIYHRNSGERDAPAFIDEDIRPHSPFINEQILLDMVRTGNLEYHQALSTAGSASLGIRTKTSDPIKQAKYSVVAFTTLCARAAIDGGLSADTAYSMSDLYTEKVDSCTTINQIAAVSHAMYEDFILRVNRCRGSSGVSRAVQSACDYIENHVMEDISVETLASRCGYTAYYFSRIFKKETGKTVREYIRSAKFRQAKILLATTSLSVQEISEKLGFCSQSYFSNKFRESEGVLPTEYRQKHHNR